MSAHRISRRAEIVLVAVLAGAATLSVWGSHANSPSLAIGLAQDVHAESTALYCTGFGGSRTDLPASVRFFNTTSDPRHVDVQEATGHGDFLVDSFTVAPFGRYDMTPSVFPGHSYYGLSALVSGGGVTAAVRASAEPALEVPCVSSGASRWSFTGLSTRVGVTAELTLLNPTATPTVVNLTAITSSGFSAPQSFQGIVVKAHGLVALDLGSQIVNSSLVYVSVHAVRGVIVPAVALSWKGASSGATVVAGSSLANTSWSFADVPTSNPVTSTVCFANPGNFVAHVTLRVLLSGYSITPFRFDVGPRSLRELTVSPSSRVPAAEPAQVSIESSAPITASLLTSLAGSKVPWMSAAGVAGTHQIIDDTNGLGLSNLSIMNPGSYAASVTISLLDAVPARSLTVTVSAHGSVSLSRRIKQLLSTSQFIDVVSDRPVLVGANPTQLGPAVAVVQNASGSR